MSTSPLLIDTGIRIDGVPVRLTVSDWGKTPIGSVYHFEYRSVSDPPQGIPISESGYKSDFLIAPDTLSPVELEEYARAFCAMLLDEIIPAQPEEPSLFG